MTLWYTDIVNVTNTFNFKGLEDLFEVVCCRLMAESLTKGKTLYRASVGVSAGTETQYNGAVNRFTTVNGGRLSMREHEINAGAKTSFVTWNEGIAIVTWDDDQSVVKIEYATHDSSLYANLSASCYVALSASW